jgi:Icc protein
MRILRLDGEPFHTLSFSLGPSGTGPRGFLPFHRATVYGLPEALDAIIATSDLQGIVYSNTGGSPWLLGEAVALELDVLRAGGEVGPKDRTAAFLAGDLHAQADEADVREVWLAMSRECRWVAGVAGNHDLFGPSGTSSQEARAALGRSNMHFLNGDTVRLDGLYIGGLSGIVSRKKEGWNRQEDEYVSAIARMAEENLDVLLCHDGPNVSGTKLAGWPSVRCALEASTATLIIRGHDAWNIPLATLANDAQVLNVEGRVVLLGRE